MKFGVVIPNYGKGASRENILATMQAAEELGFHSVWLTDHIALPEVQVGRFANLYESTTTMAFLAGNCKRIRLGISTLVLPQRNPLEIAKKIATLDALSNGRVMLSVGVGWSMCEYQNLGYDFHNRGKRMDEAIQVLRLFWKGESAISFHGKHYTFENVSVSPLTYQKNGPPIWIAGDSPIAIQRAVRLGDGWHPNSRPLSQFVQEIQHMRELDAVRNITIAMRFRVNFHKLPSDQRPLYGNATKLVHQLHAYQQSGLSYGIVHFEGESVKNCVRMMRKFSQEVQLSV
ncbi:MAG TPA: LLM class F420-dependent oxidoreductase [Anaerolineae bacterium]|nr:LLM class F420-dependent oxidoreductase [Anaerolineae bacterium]